MGLPLARRRVRPNGLYGLRTPATFAHEQVWYDANALCGRDLMILGSLLILLAGGLPSVVALSSRSYKHAYTILLLVGVLVVGVRGWSNANRLWRSAAGGVTGRWPKRVRSLASEASA